MDKAKAAQVVAKAREISKLMHEICSFAERDEAISELIVAQYPFAQSLDEVANDVILWRDAMAEKAEVPL